MQAHYDLSNDFFALWLDPSMTYSSGLWEAGDDDGLEAATSSQGPASSSTRWTCPRVGACSTSAAAGVPPWPGRSTATPGPGRRRPDPERRAEGALRRASRRVAPTCGSRPGRSTCPPAATTASSASAPSSTSRGTAAARSSASSAYRRFFASCHAWLTPGGRLGLETIAHDDAPDTAAPKGRGPLGDAVLDLFPESLCPHLPEIVLGFEPWFRLEVLRSDAGGLRPHVPGLVRCGCAGRRRRRRTWSGAATVRTFRRYLASSEVQFRTGALTNYRLVLRRRDVPHPPAPDGAGRTKAWTPIYAITSLSGDGRRDRCRLDGGPAGARQQHGVRSGT